MISMKEFEKLVAGKISTNQKCCWLWNGGYVEKTPVFTSGKYEGLSVRRLSWIAKNNNNTRRQTYPDCGNPRCVSPYHTRLADGGGPAAAKQKRAKTGKNSTPASFAPVLCAEQKSEVLRRYRGGETQKAIAAAFNVHQSTISRVVNGRSRRTTNER